MQGRSHNFEQDFISKLFLQKTLKKLCSRVVYLKIQFRALWSETDFCKNRNSKLLLTFQNWTFIFCPNSKSRITFGNEKIVFFSFGHFPSH
jgi:hypothetical protein